MHRKIAERPLGLVGTIRYETRDALTGQLIPEESGEVHNIVTNVGLNEIARILTQPATGTTYEVAVGTGSTAPAAGNTALVAEVYRAVVTSLSSSGAVFTVKLFLGAGNANGNTLAEAGLIHNSVMVDRALLSPTIAKTAAKTVTIQIDLTFSR